MSSNFFVPSVYISADAKN